MPTRRPLPTPRRPVRRVPAALAVTLAVGMLAGCGSSGASPPEDTSSPQDDVLAFYQCLRDEGLDVADPGPAGDGAVVAAGGPAGLDIDDPAVAAAVDRCGDEVGQVTFGDGEMGENMAETDALIEFVDCMRDHGIDMADPGPDGRLSMPTNFDPQDPAFQTATQECGPLLGGGGVLIGGGDGSSGRSGG